MKHLLLAQLLVFSSVVFGAGKPAECELASKSILGRTPSGLAQVSNLGAVQVTCHVSPRPFPTKPGEIRNSLGVATTAYKISPNGSEKLVPSEVELSGGGGDGFGPNPKPEYVVFLVLIPLAPADLLPRWRRRRYPNDSE